MSTGMKASTGAGSRQAEDGLAEAPVEHGVEGAQGGAD